MQERSEAERRAIMAMPQCCYLAKGAKRPSHTTNTIKFDRIPFDPSNSIKRFDLCPFDQKNSTCLQPPPCKNPGLRLDDQQLRISIGLRLGANICCAYVPREQHVSAKIKLETFRQIFHAETSCTIFCFWFSTNWLSTVCRIPVCRILELKKNDKTIGNLYDIFENQNKERIK